MFGASKDLHDSVPSQKRSWQAFGESSGKGCPSFRAENRLLARQIFPVRLQVAYPSPIQALAVQERNNIELCISTWHAILSALHGGALLPGFSAFLLFCVCWISLLFATRFLLIWRKCSNELNASQHDKFTGGHFTEAWFQGTKTMKLVNSPAVKLTCIVQHYLTVAAPVQKNC